MDEYHYLNFQRYTENDYILGIFNGFFYNSVAQKDNINKLPFEFSFNITTTRYENVFSMEPFDLRSIFKENNIYCHYLDFYLKDSKIDTNDTFRFYLNAGFNNIWALEKKCNVKKEPKEEYAFDNYDNDCITMIEHIEPKKANSSEKLYESQVFKLAEYIPDNKYEHVLCKTSNRSDCKYKYSDDSEYEMMFDDRGYEVINSTSIWNTAKPIYLYQQYAYKYDKLNIHFK